MDPVAPVKKEGSTAPEKSSRGNERTDLSGTPDRKMKPKSKRKDSTSNAMERKDEVGKDLISAKVHRRKERNCSSGEFGMTREVGVSH